MTDKLPTLITPSDIKTWVAAFLALAAGTLSFVQSERWEIALLAVAGVLSVVLLALFMLNRLRTVEAEVRECRASHEKCDDRVASAHTAIAVLYTRLALHDPSLPRLADLLGDDATAAILRAGDADAARAQRSVQGTRAA